MAEIVGAIWPGTNGQREHIVRLMDITTDEDAKHKQFRYRGYSPTERKLKNLLMGGDFNA